MTTFFKNFEGLIAYDTWLRAHYSKISKYISHKPDYDFKDFKQISEISSKFQFAGF